MSWSWIFRILWAQRAILLIATICSLLGGVVVCLISPPRYLATARVVLDYVKPDVETGQYMPTKMVDAYVSSQVQMIGDYQVTIPAVDSMGWLDSPDLQEAYANRPPGDDRRFEQWVAGRLAGGLSARMVEDSNILQIEFRAASPQLASTVVEALRQAFVEANVAQRRIGASQRADALTKRADLIRTKIGSLESIKNDYERQNGVSLGRGPRDPDSSRLRELALAKDQVFVPSNNGVISTAASQLTAIDARIASVGAGLGANNPELKAMQARREALRAQVAAEENHSRSVANAVTQMGAARAEMVEDQKRKVLSQRDKILQLRLYQDEIDGYRDQLGKALQQAANSRAMINADQSGLTPVGAAVSRPKPVFPNPLLILMGSGGLGLAIGVLLALFTEFMRRRVRDVMDIELAGLAPVLGIVPQARAPRAKRRAGSRKARRLVGKAGRAATA